MALALTLTVFSLPVSVLILPFFVIPGLFTYVIVQQEKRAQEIERTAPVWHTDLQQATAHFQITMQKKMEEQYISKEETGTENKATKIIMSLLKTANSKTMPPKKMEEQYLPKTKLKTAKLKTASSKTTLTTMTKN